MNIESSTITALNDAKTLNYFLDTLAKCLLEGIEVPEVCGLYKDKGDRVVGVLYKYGQLYLKTVRDDEDGRAAARYFINHVNKNMGERYYHLRLDITPTTMYIRKPASFKRVSFPRNVANPIILVRRLLSLVGRYNCGVWSSGTLSAVKNQQLYKSEETLRKAVREISCVDMATIDSKLREPGIDMVSGVGVQKIDISGESI